MRYWWEPGPALLFSPSVVDKQSFDSWGERRNANNLTQARTSDSQPFLRSSHEYDRGYTGHEQLDDSGLIHMNGRIYDPELGRMLSPDPYVQVPEYSQNFNRYSYVMNNPLNMTDPTGFSWISKAVHKLGNWIKENWKTIVAIVIAVVAWYAAPYIVAGAFGSAGIVTTPAVFQAAAGALAGAMAGAANAALQGGDWGDVLRGALIGGVQGGISAGVLHGMEAKAVTFGEKAAHVAGHGVVGGLANEAMGGKFQDGFLSAAAGAAAGWAGVYKATATTGVVGRTVTAGIIGGTVSAIGGGKFANGAYTAAFQHLLNQEISNMDASSLRKSVDRYSNYLKNMFGSGNVPIMSEDGLELQLENAYRNTKQKGFQNMSYKTWSEIAMPSHDGPLFQFGKNQITLLRRPGIFGYFFGARHINYGATDLNYIYVGMGGMAKGLYYYQLTELGVYSHNLGLSPGSSWDPSQIGPGLRLAKVGADYYYARNSGLGSRSSFEIATKSIYE